MTAIRTLIALSAAALATACASPDAMNAAPASPSMSGMSGMAGMAGMGDGKGMSADMTKRHQMMTDHMATMQMLMDMMADRMPAAPATK